MTPAGKPQDPGKKRRRESASDLRQSDLANDIHGKNKLQGHDQLAVRNQRRTQPRVGGAAGRPEPRSEDSDED